MPIPSWLRWPREAPAAEPVPDPEPEPEPLVVPVRVDALPVPSLLPSDGPEWTRYVHRETGARVLARRLTGKCRVRYESGDLAEGGDGDYLTTGADGLRRIVRGPRFEAEWDEEGR